MPGGDGTGPMREGPMIGGGFGPCGGGRRSAGSGFGARGGGYGRGAGWRNRRWAPDGSGWRRAGAWNQAAAPWSPENERDMLQRDEAALESELEHLRARIAELEKTE